MLWPGQGLYVGPLLPNAAHAHHAVQLTAALTGRFTTMTRHGTRRRVAAAVFASDETHALSGSATTIQLYLDPASWPGLLGHDPHDDPIRRRLVDRTRKQLQTLQHLWDDHAPLNDWKATLARITDIGRRPAGAPGGVLDLRVTAAMARVHATPGEPPSMREAAAHAQLSPGRFGHLFTECTGLPYRRYFLWVRLITAVAAMQPATPLTAIAHDVGFADQAHLTRTFRRMFGIAPSTLATQIARIEIDLAGWAPPGTGH